MPKEIEMEKRECRKVGTMVKLSRQDRAEVEKAAQREGLSISAVVRRAIKNDKAIKKHRGEA